MEIVGRHIVITGGTSGIGLELVRQLQAANEISVIARPSAKLDDLRNTFEGIRIYEADLADLQSVEDAVEIQRALATLAKTYFDIATTTAAYRKPVISGWNNRSDRTMKMVSGSATSRPLRTA